MTKDMVNIMEQNNLNYIYMPYTIRKLPNKNLYRVYVRYGKPNMKIIAKATTLNKAKAQVRMLEKKEIETAKKKINPKYIKGLKGKDVKKQIKSILEGKNRPKTNAPKRKSKWTMMAKKYFKKSPTLKDIQQALKLKSTKGLREIIKKGEGAYYSAGSRPNQSARSWGLARLYAVIFGGKKVRKVDKDIISKYGIGILKI